MPYTKTAHNHPSEPRKPVLANPSGISPLRPHYQCECGKTIILRGYELNLWQALSKVGTTPFEDKVEESTERILDYATEYKDNYEELFYGGHPTKGKRQRHFPTPMRGLRKVLANVIRSENTE